MKIIVCVKQIPDPADPYRLDPDTHFLDRPDDQVLDDTDRYGVEMGLQLAGEEGTVTLLSLGPAGNMQGIRQALAMGADEAIIITDEAFRGSGALTTAKALAAAARRREFDLVIAGTESTDGYTGIVPQQMAALLSIPSLTYARRISVEGSTVKVEQQTATGYAELKADLPAVVSVTAGVVEPRYPTFKGIMAAKSKPVETLNATDLRMEASEVGAEGAGQEIIEVLDAPARSGGTRIEDDGTAHQAILDKLRELKVLS